MPSTALIIDDEPDIRELVAMTLTRAGIDTHCAANLAEARNLLEEYEFDVCLTDMRLPDGNGVEFVKHLQTVQPELPVAVITAHGNMDAAVEAMKNGAFDFVSKPVDIAQLRTLVTQALSLGSQSPVAAANDEYAAPPSNNSLAALSGKTGTATEKTSDDPLRGGDNLIGASPPMQALRKLIVKVARTNAPIWITGESGTGKELIARLIHQNSPRCDKPFVAINCGAIPSELMESELFGHTKGSFTGATADKLGLFRQADGGTLFLDEVAELPLHMQVKLLRAIQERQVRPVGAAEEHAIDARILSASHKDLASEVEHSRFRHDLYYRLNVISIESPALRHRSDDIPSLCDHILEKLTDTRERGSATSIDPAAIAHLRDYAFPGNIRELENLIERALTMADGPIIGSDDFIIPQTDVTVDNDSVLDNTQGESAAILKALTETRWNRKAAADLLGLSYRQLRYRIQILGLDRSKDAN